MRFQGSKFWGRQWAKLSVFGTICLRRLQNTPRKPNFLLQTVAPNLTEEYASAHDGQMWFCCRKILHLAEHGTPALAQTIVSLPLGQGIGFAQHSSVAWCSTLEQLLIEQMVHKRHQAVCGSIVASLRRDDQSFVQALGQSDTEVRNAGLVAPAWEDLVVDREDEEDDA